MIPDFAYNDFAEEARMHDIWKAGHAAFVMIPLTGRLSAQFPKDESGRTPHITILYQKDPRMSEVGLIKDAVKGAVESMPRFDIKVGGLAYFDNGDERVAYAMVESEEIHTLRGLIEANMRTAGVEPDSFDDNGFKPHATIQYLKADESWDGKVPTGTQTAKVVEVWTSEGRTVYSFGVNVEPNVKKSGRMDIGVIANGVDGVRIPCSKSADEQYVLGIVLIPETVDTQGDIYSAEEIRRAAFSYMAGFKNGSGQTGLQHKRRIYDDVTMVESYVAPADFMVGSRVIKLGTWLIGWIVNDDGLWKKIKAGEFTGFSIGGTAKKTKIRRG